jgi:hypothetical protein
MSTARRNQAPHPAPDDFDGPNHDIVHVAANARPDGHNRVQFTAHWLADREIAPSGVRGQVFFADPDARIREWEAEGRKVTVVRIGGPA